MPQRRMQQGSPCDDFPPGPALATVPGRNDQRLLRQPGAGVLRKDGEPKRE